MINQHLTTETIIDFLHGELASLDDARVHLHLAGCPACQGIYDAEAMLGETLKAAAAAEEREMPSLVSAAVWQRIREARPGPFARLAAFMRPVVAVPVAAAIVAGAFFASSYGHVGSAPKIDATYYLQAHAVQAGLSPLSDHPGSQMLETSMVDSAPDRSVADRYTSDVVAGAPDAVQ